MAGFSDAKGILSMRLLFRNGLLCGLTGVLLVGCLSITESGEEIPAMTRAERIEAATGWYGLLLNPTDGINTVNTAAMGETIQILQDEGKHWREWRGKVARSLRKSATPRRDFYAGIEDISLKSALLETRRRLQAGLVNTSIPKDKEILEAYALAAEHAVLTERVVRLGNGVALGQIKGQAFLAAAGNLKTFRSEFRPLLSKSLPLLENQERKIFDATGLDLLEIVGSDRILTDFFGPPEALFKDGVSYGKNADKPGAEKWETVPRRIFPRPPSGSEKTSETLFRLSVPSLDTIDGKSGFKLVFWEATASFSVTLNDRSLGRVEGIKHGRSVILPVERGTLVAPENTLTLIVSLPGKQTALPFRAAFLVVAD